MVDRVVEIERKNWPALRDLYAPNSPKTFLGHTTVDNFIRWTDQLPDISNEVVFYCLNGDWSDGTFAVVRNDFMYTYTLSNTSDRLRRLLQLIDFSKGLKVHTVLSKDHSVVLDVIKSKNSQIQYDSEALLHHLPATDALNFDLTPPEGITLKPIEQSDVHIAADIWSYRDKGTLQLLQQLAQLNPSVGAYNNDGRMIAWVFRLPSGPLGVLQVDEEFYGRGLGMLVSKAQCRKIAELGHDICACIQEGNTHSLAIFKKLGFRIVDKIHWTETLPVE